MNSKIYFPAEDSLFLKGFMKREVDRLRPGKILDMGSGSGIQAEACIESGIKQENMTLSDINENALEMLRKKFPESRAIMSDLFAGIKDKYDLIIFNPPYLPDSRFDKKPDTSGGKNGSEIINRFLKDAKEHILSGGEILLLTSSFAKGVDFSGYERTLLGKKRIFFEELYVWRLKIKG